MADRDGVLLAGRTVERNRMKTTLLIRARRHFNSGMKHIDRHNQRAWIRAIRMLGDKWLLAKQVERA
jgi:hypothetical protein